MGVSLQILKKNLKFFYLSKKFLNEIKNVMPDIIKLSRSTVEKYLSCPRCCVLDKRYQIKPPSLPFTLNIAVDNLCKNEFDYYRKIQEPHPLFIEYGIDAVPFKHKDLERWRSNFQGIRYKSIEHNYDFGGAIDDIWQKKNGDLIIVDVKATSRNNFDWFETFNKYEYAKAYKRQLEMYQWSVSYTHLTLPTIGEV